MAEFFLHKGSPTYLHPENADVMSISQFMAQNLRQPPPPIPPPPKHTFEISEGESVEIEKIVAAEKKDGQLYYKVKWVKYTWEAEESIQHLPHLIDGYWREHFYQNINQAAIDTTGINLVNSEKAADGTVVVNASVTTTENNTETATQTTQITTPSRKKHKHHSSGDAVDVMLEFTMGGHAPSTKLTAREKKERRAFPMERKYVCQICTKAFDRNTSLTRHMLVHTREKPFKCQLCDKAFSQNAHLKRHILIHIGQKSYQCNKCGKMFIEKGGLARHEATHSTEKPWVCNQCGKAFVLNEYLQRHLFLHTGQKPYQCNECGRLFADGSSWRAHKQTHNKEKKYKCPVCSKMLKCKRNFKKHVQSHSDEKEMKYQCDICLEKFPNKKILKEHWRDAKNTHRCRFCKKFMKNREIFVEHMATHDPNSETYDPVIHSPDPNDPDELALAEEEALKKSQALGHDPTTKTDMENTVNADNNSDDDDDDNDGDDDDEKEEGEVGGREEGEVLLDKILDHSQDESDENQRVTQVSTSPVSSSFTQLILKSEHVNRMVPTEEDGNSPAEHTHVRISATSIADTNQVISQVPNVLNLNASATPIPVHMTAPTPTIDVVGTPQDENHLLSMSRVAMNTGGVSHVALQPNLQHSISNVIQQHPHHQQQQLPQLDPQPHISHHNQPRISHNEHQQQQQQVIQHPTINHHEQQQLSQQPAQIGTVDNTVVSTQENAAAGQQSASEADVAETIILITQNNDVEMQDSHQM